MLFGTNRHLLWKALLGNTINTDAYPDQGETWKFWSNILDYPKELNKNAIWIKEFEKNIGLVKMDDIVITSYKIKNKEG